MTESMLSSCMFPLQCRKMPPKFHWPPMNGPPQFSGISPYLINQYIVIQIHSRRKIGLNIYPCLVSAPVYTRFIRNFTTAIREKHQAQSLRLEPPRSSSLDKKPASGMVDITKTNVVRNRRMTLERPKPHQGSTTKVPDYCIVKATVNCSSVHISFSHVDFPALFAWGFECPDWQERDSLLHVPPVAH